MFTGIVQAVGTVAGLERRGQGARLAVKAGAVVKRLKRGDSIAVNGCCLTIVQKRGGTFVADLTGETLKRTSLGGMKKGDRVNLEAPLRAGDALSGHLLQGHVEATGRVVGLEPDGGEGGYWLRVSVPAEVARYLAPKGSIAVDGISLTVAELRAEAAGGAEVGIAIIPYTFRHTRLRGLKAGAGVNLETDPIARHLEALLEARGLGTQLPARDVDAKELRRQGF